MRHEGGIVARRGANDLEKRNLKAHQRNAGRHQDRMKLQKQTRNEGKSTYVRKPRGGQGNMKSDLKEKEETCSVLMIEI